MVLLKLYKGKFDTWWFKIILKLTNKNLFSSCIHKFAITIAEMDVQIQWKSSKLFTFLARIQQKIETE